MKAHAAPFDAISSLRTRQESGETLVGFCVAARHAVLKSRVLVSWTTGEREEKAWLPHLAGLAIRQGDRVLFTSPSNHNEAIVVGVLDGLVSHQAEPKERGPQIELAADEALCIASHDGTPILEVTSTPEGPHVRLLEADGLVSFPGKLKIRAQDVRLEATSGEIRLSASGDVKVVGEVVRLN